MAIPEELRRRISAAHQEALRVGDSQTRADHLGATIAGLIRDVGGVAEDESKSRILAALADAERVLRRDDDGREAGRHLQTALRLTDDRPPRPSPF